MKIRSIAHKGLRNLVEKDDARKLPADYVEKIRAVVSRLIAMEDISEFLRIPRGKPHKLKGDRADVYAIAVYANWRITFRHDREENEIWDLNFEDYH